MLEPEEIKRWERMTAAMIRHAAEDDPEAFAQIVTVLDNARQRLPMAAQMLVGGTEEQGLAAGAYSWADLGRALGISR